MSAPKKIYLWNCNGKISRNHYPRMQAAINAVIRRFKIPDSFGIPMYINERNILEYVKDKIEVSKSGDCKAKAALGVYSAIEDIYFIKDLKKLLEEK